MLAGQPPPHTTHQVPSDGQMLDPGSGTLKSEVPLVATPLRAAPLASMAATAESVSREADSSRRVWLCREVARIASAAAAPLHEVGPHRRQHFQRTLAALALVHRTDAIEAVRIAANDAYNAVDACLDGCSVWDNNAASTAAPAKPFTATAEHAAHAGGGAPVLATATATEELAAAAAETAMPVTAYKSASAFGAEMNRDVHTLCASKQSKSKMDADKERRGAEQFGLVEELKIVRKTLAGGKPAFCVFSDEVLEQIARARPTSAEALLAVRGMGPKRVQDFGEQLLACVKQFAPASSAAEIAQPAAASEAAPAPRAPDIKDAPLNADQQRALDMAMQGSNVFITGGAGVGKSFTLNRIVAELRRAKGEDAVFITASTGIAACHIGGTTLHSFSGIGLGKEAASELAGRVLSARNDRRNGRGPQQRWEACEVLVIDEVSMLEADLFDKLEYIARKVRSVSRSPSVAARADAPFGGIQLVLCGDFFQLPPVGMKGGGPNIKFMFEAKCWPTTVHECVVLREVFRQKEQSFVTLLNEMRRGALSPFHTSLLSGLVGVTPTPRPTHDASAAVQGGDTPATAVDVSTEQSLLQQAPPPTAIKLFAHNEAADNENRRRLAEISGRVFRYRANDSGPQRRQLADNCIVPTELELKLNAQVILCKNLEPAAKLVNGSRGRVIGFVPKMLADLQDVELAPEEEGVSSKPETGWGRRAGCRLYPIVKFEVGPNDYQQRIIIPQDWSIESGDKVVAQRWQIPLKLAWAISIHKSQGMTLSSVELDLARCFEPGQAYVALSRAVSLDGAVLLSFDASRVHAHPKVVRFYDSLDMPAQSCETRVSASSAAPVRTGLSDEQRKRMEANRAAAMAKRAKVFPR